MEKYLIRKKIVELINSIKEHSDNIGDFGYIPQLELESILHKIEKLYEKSIVYNYLNSLSDAPVEPIMESNPTDIEPPVSKLEIKEDLHLKQETEAKPVSADTAPILDLFGSDAPPIAEKPKPVNPTQRKIAKPSITDIKSVIGINDKFQFINEMFGGNAPEYAVAIQQLNSSESLENALEYFNGLQAVYSWDMENETVKRLLDFVNRRYS